MSHSAEQLHVDLTHFINDFRSLLWFYLFIILLINPLISVKYHQLTLCVMTSRCADKSLNSSVKEDKDHTRQYQNTLTAMKTVLIIGL